MKTKTKQNESVQKKWKQKDGEEIDKKKEKKSMSQNGR